MDKNVRTIISIVLVIMFLGSTAMMIHQKFNYEKGEASYDDAARLSGLTGDAQTEASSEIIENISEGEVSETLTGETAESSEESEAPAPEVWIPEPVENDPHMELLRATDLNALREVNEDVIGWIMIPDTEINYPLMQGEDNEYYLDYTWDKKKNAVGSIFLESTNSPDITDFHTIIYGHNIKNGKMFGAVKDYRSQDFWTSHPYVYIVTDTGVCRYEIYASYEAEVTSYTYRLGFKTDEDKQDFVNLGMEQSVIETGITPEITDRILTLSTCTGGGYATRWVVQARLKMVTESSVASASP